MDRESLIHLTRQYLSGDADIQLAYLFGSRVNGTLGPMSDIDLGVLFVNKGDLLSMQSQLSYRLGKTVSPLVVDVVVLNTAPIELAHEVISQGICVYQRNQEIQVDYEARILSQYADYLPFLTAMKMDIQKETSYEHKIFRYRETFQRTERTLSQIRDAQHKNKAGI
jgi:predicted nucleotidyltransferase